MSQKKDNRLLILGGVGALAVVLALVFSAVSISGKKSGAAEMTVSEYRYDFGTISMADGDARHEFIIRNAGDENLTLSDIRTSCMCTTAELNIAGERSPVFGMHNNPAFWVGKIAPGEEAALEVVFDPLAHGPNATGSVTREIVIQTNDQGSTSAIKRFIITANVVK